MSSSTKTLTEGPLAKQIFLVSLPLALSNLLQVLFKMGTGSTTHTYDEPSKPSDGKRLQIIEAVP